MDARVLWVAIALSVVAGLSATSHQAGTRTDVTAIAFSRDGRVATGNESGTVVVSDASSGARQHTLQLGQWVRSLAFSPDGRTLLAGDHGHARAWTARTGAVVADFDLTRGLPEGVGAGAVEDLVFIDADTFVAAVFHHIQQWRVSSGTLVKWAATTGWRRSAFMSTCCGCHVRALSVSPDGRAVMAGCPDGFAYLWDLRSNRLTEIVDGHGEHHQGPAVWLSSNSRWLFLMPDAETFGNALLLRDRSGDRERLTGASVEQVMSVAISPNGRLLAAGSAVGPVDVWNLSSPNPVASWSTGDFVGALRFSPDSTRLATGGRDGVVELWDATSGRRLWRTK